MKNERQNAILRIIELQDVETQEDMIVALRETGFEVTQATVSRDIRELKLTKTLSASGNYKYARATAQAPVSAPRAIKFNHAVSDAITSIEYSRNIVVLKTFPGLAMAVASGIDALELKYVLGTIAGDDTIMVVTRDDDASQTLCREIEEMTGTVSVREDNGSADQDWDKEESEENGEEE